MASIRKDVLIEAPAEQVWDAVRDVGSVHDRLAPGFVVATQLDGGARVVTFASGFVVRELIVAIDDAERRLAYAAVGGRSTHHNASMQVFPEGPRRCRLVWITDFLPDDVAQPIGAIVEQGAAAIKATLEAATAGV